MPLYIDHVGLNTLVNQDLDLTTNTLNTGSSRTLAGTVVDRSFECGKTQALEFAGLITYGRSLNDEMVTGDSTTVLWPSSSATQHGLAMSTWVYLNPGGCVTCFKTIASGFVDDGTLSGHPSQTNAGGPGQTGQSFSWNFEDGSSATGGIRLMLEESGTNDNTDHAQWHWDVDVEEDFYGKWNHLYLTIHPDAPKAADYDTSVTLYINGVLKSLTSHSKTGGYDSLKIQPVHRMTLMDHCISPAGNTFYELDGRMQDFILYHSHSTRRAEDLYTAGALLNSPLPDSSKISARMLFGERGFPI